MKRAGHICSLVLLTLSGVSGESSCSSSVIAGTLQVLVDGVPKSVYVVDSSKSESVSVKGNAITLPHGPRIYIADECTSSMSSDMFWFPDFTKYSLSFTVDISDMGCGCNGAVYLVNMPAASITSCGDYYCDANYVCGEGCNEFDIMEANNHAAQVTPHKCGADGTSDCDGGGCATKLEGYGKAGKAIDTTKPFRVELAVGAAGAAAAGATDDDQASSASATTTTYFQGDDSVVVRHTDESCGGSYMEGMQPSWQNMVVTVSNWGDSGSGMAWLDGDAGCSDSTSCNKGAFTVSDFRLCSLEGGNNPGCASMGHKSGSGDGGACGDDDKEWYSWGWCKGSEWATESHTWWQWSLAVAAGVFLLALLCLALRACLSCSRRTCVKCFSCCRGKEEKPAVKPQRRQVRPRREMNGGRNAELKSPLLS